MIPQPAGLDVEKLEYKRSEDEKEREQRLHKELVSFYIKEVGTYIFGILCLTSVVIYCIWALFHESTTPEERRYVWAALSAIIGGIVGFVCGRSTK